MFASNGVNIDLENHMLIKCNDKTFADSAKALLTGEKSSICIW